jgi:hypothetical protein
MASLTAAADPRGLCNRAFAGILLIRVFARGQERRRRPRISDRAAGELLFGYLALCIVAGVILEAITDWPIGSMIIVIAVFYVLLVFLGAAIVRPIATITMIVFRSVRRENRRDTGRGRRASSPRSAQPARPGRRILRRRAVVSPADASAADGAPPSSDPVSSPAPGEPTR